MKIAIICPNYPPSMDEGGLSHYTKHLSYHLDQLEEKICVVTNESFQGDGANGSISVLKIPQPWGMASVRRIVKELRLRSVDLINLQYTPVMYSARFKFLWYYITQYFTTVVSFHTLWGGSRLNYIAALNLLISSSSIIATNSEIVYLLKRYFPISLKKSHFIPISTNILPVSTKSDCGHTLRKYLSKPSKHQLVFFGMPYPGKGISLLLRVTQILIKKYKADVHLLIIGGGISDEQHYIQVIKRLLRKLDIENNVTWTGKISAAEVSALLCCATLVVLPFESGVSDRRGSLMAALAHHKAVVTARPSVPIELFKNDDNMVWTDINDPENFAQTVFQVLTDHEYRRRIESGAAELIRHFDWTDIAAKTRDCFRQTLKRNS